MRRRWRTRTFRLVGVLAAALFLLARAPIAEAISTAEKSFLSLYFSEEELQVVSATRSLQSIARIAENIEVVTADDIELMNAHTLADVLNTVNGVKVNFTGGFGAVAMAHIQGSDFAQVAILLDGVPLSNLTDSMTEVGFLAVTDVARIEIVKGPASSAWGSALGGVVNVITKSPGEKPFEGKVSLGYGTKKSADYRAAVSGRVGGLGYYLSGTGLRTDGLTDGFDADLGFLGARLEYAFAPRTTATLSVSHGSGPRGEGNFRDDDLSWDRHTRQTVAKLGLRSDIGEAGRLDCSLWSVDASEAYFTRVLSSGEEMDRSTVDWSRLGAGASYSWSRGAHELVFGADYAAGEIETTSIPDRKPEVDQWALFANDTITLGGWSIIPGIRYDDISISGGFVSPSLGATWALSPDVLLRAAVARGFSAPSPIDTSAGVSEIMFYQGNPDLRPEKIWSYQAGVEANLLDAVWLKLMAFRHDVDDAFVGVELENGLGSYINQGSQRREGLEIGLKTVPWRRLTASVGASIIKAEDRDTGDEVFDVPKEQLNVSLKYDDGRSLRALLRGNYRREKNDPGWNADFSGFIWDANVAWRVPLFTAVGAEVFLAVHNLFNGDQYYADIYLNPERWVEGGVRVAF